MCARIGRTTWDGNRGSTTPSNQEQDYLRLLEIIAWISFQDVGAHEIKFSLLFFRFTGIQGSHTWSGA